MEHGRPENGLFIDVADLLAAGPSPDELFPRVLSTIGERMGWTYGGVWQPAGDPAMLQIAATWTSPAEPEAHSFADAAQDHCFAPGRGLPGRVWATRKVTWVADVGSDPHAPRVEIALGAGLRCAMAFPVLYAGECVGVIEFFTSGEMAPIQDELLLTIGSQLGQYLASRRSHEDETRRVEAMLRYERDRAQRYLDVAGCVIVVLDADGRVELVNKRGCTVLGRTEEELAGADWIETVVPEHERAVARRAFAQRVSGELEADDAYESEILTATGGLRRIAWHTSVLRNADGAIAGTVSSGEDVTDRRRDEEKITYLAYHDALTGLPNRMLLQEHLKLALARSRRMGTGLALLHIDLDGFKLVNDSLGHSAGDELLCRLAVRLQEVTRATDLLARLGGDEFLLLLADLHDEPAAVAERVAGQVISALSDPFMLGGTEFQIGATIGISTCPEHAQDAEALLNAADTAMYQSKVVARGGWALYSATSGDPLERLSMSVRLRRALTRNEFLLHYQPIFALDGVNNRLEGVEALVRWEDPDRGMVSPGDFIPVAEETGLIESIGDWVFRAVCEQQVDWAARGFHPQISFNVSPRQLRRLDFADRVALHLEESGADPAKLTLELTESSTLQDPAAAEPILRTMHELGLQIALDDFGAGYSSLSRLREMPVETLKIDRAFLREVPENPEASAIVTAILRLGRALGRTTVAEGVETDAQRAFLVEQRCPLVQGFLLGRPLPAAEVEALMSAGVVA